MRLISPPSRRVVWEDGMHLSPQHFQAQHRYHQDQTARTAALLAPFSYGLSSLVIDDDALRNGTLRVVQVRAVLPDGTVVHVPESNQPPAPFDVAQHFSPTRDGHVVHLAVPVWRVDAANVAGDMPDAARRFVPREDVLVDESTGADPVPVRLAEQQLQLRLDDALGDEVVTMPIARLVRDGRGQFALDPLFVPPVLHLAASERLLGLLRDIVALLEAKGASLTATLSQATAVAAGGGAAYMGNELATRWLLHAVRSADAPLRHLLLTRRAHPERLYTELARLAGALCAFSMTSHPRDVPLYDHDDATTTFAVLERQLRAHLDVVVSARAVVVPLQRVSDVLHTAAIADPRCFEPGARWFLAVRADLGAADLVDRMQRLTKTCASKFVLELVRRAFNGLATEHIPMPPAALAPKPDLQYFELTMAGPCALSMNEARDIGVYVPEALPGAYLELAVLLPS